MAKKMAKTKDPGAQSPPPVRFDPADPMKFFNHPDTVKARANVLLEAEREDIFFNHFSVEDHYSFERPFVAAAQGDDEALAKLYQVVPGPGLSAESLTMLGFKYLEREPYDVVRGLNCLRQAAEMGYDCAKAHYGFNLYTRSENLEVVLDGLANLEEVAEAGNAWALTQLARIAFEGFPGCRPAPTKAKRYLAQAAEKGYSVALASLGALNLGLTGHPKNAPLALDFLRRAANKGNGPAMNYLGVSHFKGRHGLDKDAERTLGLLAGSAKTAYGPGIENLLLARQLLGGSREDWVSDMEVYEWAAEKGLPQAMTALGQIHARGLGGEPVDLPKAVGRFMQAAAVQYVPGSVELAKCLLFGAGIPQDPEKGLTLLNVSADEGDKEAMFVLSVLYRNGYAVEANPGQAYRLAEKAGQ
ncbi:MAG: sel1 repeat family protein [Deltaproteobacteria bacterium]|jgi:TPR repeat protein|nr:sel1 repeat family protein [Deltaproteobacteria bacterium]